MTFSRVRIVSPAAPSKKVFLPLLFFGFILSFATATREKKPKKPSSETSPFPSRWARAAPSPLSLSLSSHCSRLSLSLLPNLRGREREREIQWGEGLVSGGDLAAAAAAAAMNIFKKKVDPKGAVAVPLLGFRSSFSWSMSAGWGFYRRGRFGPICSCVAMMRLFLRSESEILAGFWAFLGVDWRVGVSFSCVDWGGGVEESVISVDYLWKPVNKKDLGVKSFGGVMN